MDNDQDHKLDLIELFAGIGGAGVALAPHFRTTYANDLDPMKGKVFRLNHPAVLFDGRAIQHVRAADMHRADLLWASFPCVDHSTLGRRKGFAGGRGSLVFQVMRLLAEARLLGTMPAVVCLENVVGLLERTKQGDFRALVQALASLGYRVGAYVIEGERLLPVMRKRVFLVAVRADVAIPACLLAKGPVDAWHTPPLVAAVAALAPSTRKGWLWLDMPEPQRPVPSLASLLDEEPGGWLSPEQAERELAECLPEHVEALHRARALGPVLATKAPQPADRRPWQSQGHRIFTDGVMRCITAQKLGHRLMFADADGVRIRKPSVAELARMSGLPATFALPRAPTVALKCIGDGLCIPAVALLGEHVLAPLARASRDGEVAGPVLRPLVPYTRQRRDDTSPGRGGGVKERASTATLYAVSHDLDRLHDVAAAQGLRLSELNRRLFDIELMRLGQEPLQRLDEPRRQGAGAGRARPQKQVVHQPFPEAVNDDGAEPPRHFFAGGAAHSSNHSEWWTDPELEEALRRALGLLRFDIDAFSPGPERSNIQADLHFTKEDDAMLQDWFGDVFANPPYDRSLKNYVRRCRVAVQTGEARLVLGVLPARTDPRWWTENVVGHADVVFPRGRVAFIDGTGQKGGDSPGHATAIVLWGATAEQVAAVRAMFPGSGYMPKDQNLAQAG